MMKNTTAAADAAAALLLLINSFEDRKSATLNTAHRVWGER